MEGLAVLRKYEEARGDGSVRMTSVNRWHSASEANSAGEVWH